MTAPGKIERRREILHKTSRAAVAAEEVRLAEAVESMEWERRGLLQTLKRVPRRPAGEPDRAA
jgi:hypothetical protein